MNKGKQHIFSFFEWIPLEYSGLLIGIAGIFSGQLEWEIWGFKATFLGSVFLVVILLGLYTGKFLTPGITMGYIQPNHENRLALRRQKIIKADSGKAEIDMNFTVPSHHNEIYVSFEIEGYSVGVDQFEPVNFDMDQAVTYHSKITEFELTLRLESDSSGHGGNQPLKIVDKLHNDIIIELPVQS